MALQDTYRDIQEIGSGGGGTVYRAYHIRMEKYVVLKKIHDSIAGNGADIRRELDILKNLRHSYLPSIVHGDIKPANIMLTPQGDICLIDFNISQLKNGTVDLNMGYTPGYAVPEQIKLMKDLEMRLAAHEAAVDVSGAMSSWEGGTMLLDNRQGNGTVLHGESRESETMLLAERRESGAVLSDDDRLADGTPEKKDMLPASFSGQMIDERTDIYSVGATLYALLLGHVPGESDIASGADSGRQKCSEGLAHLINRCMAYQPGKRFRSGEEYLKAVLGIAKMDKRYRHMALRQELAAILCMFGYQRAVYLYDKRQYREMTEYLVSKFWAERDFGRMRRSALDNV